MAFELQRPLAFLNLETTSCNVLEGKAVELTMLKYLPAAQVWRHSSMPVLHTATLVTQSLFCV